MHKSNTQQIATLAAAVLLAAGCANKASSHTVGATPPFAEAPEKCSIDAPVGVTTIVPAMKTWTIGTVSATQTGRTNTQPGTDYDTVQTTIAARSQIRGTAPGLITISANAYTRLLALQGAGQLALLGIAQDGLAVITAAADSNGRLTFVGNCNTYLRASFSKFLEKATALGIQSSQEQSLLDAIQRKQPNLQALENADLPAKPDWNALDPETRNIEIDGPYKVPDVLRSTLRPMNVRYVLPTSWSGITGGICSRIPGVGWAECITYALAAQDRPATGSTFAIAGEAVEFWNMGNVSDVKSKISLLGSVTVSAQQAVNDLIELRSTRALTSQNQIGGATNPVNVTLIPGS